MAAPVAFRGQASCFALTFEPCPADYQTYQLQSTGLQGWPFRLDIHEGRGNANQLLLPHLIPLTASVTDPNQCAEWRNLRNAIPREASALLSIPTDKQHELTTWLEKKRIY